MKRLSPIVLRKKQTYVRQTLEEIVAENLKKYRKVMKLSQSALVQELARHGFSITVSSYSRAEHGTTPITLALIDACAAFYQIAPTVLLIPTNPARKLRVVEVDDDPSRVVEVTAPVGQHVTWTKTTEIE